MLFPVQFELVLNLHTKKSLLFCLRVCVRQLDKQNTSKNNFINQHQLRTARALTEERAPFPSNSTGAPDVPNPDASEVKPIRHTHNTQHVQPFSANPWRENLHLEGVLP